MPPKLMASFSRTNRVMGFVFGLRLSTVLVESDWTSGASERIDGNPGHFKEQEMCRCLPASPNERKEG